MRNSVMCVNSQKVGPTEASVRAQVKEDLLDLHMDERACVSMFYADYRSAVCRCVLSLFKCHKRSAVAQVCAQTENHDMHTLHTQTHTRIKWSLDLHACMHDTNINTWKMFRGSNSHLTTHWFPQLVTHWEVDVPTRQKVFKWGKTLICMISRGTLLTLHTFILPRVAWMSHIQVQIYVHNVAKPKPDQAAQPPPCCPYFEEAESKLTKMVTAWDAHLIRS